jgi:hypothetical protein
MDKKKEEGVVMFNVQGAMGEIKKLILPTNDVNYTIERAEEIKEAYGYGDFKMLGTIVHRGKILK